KFKSPLVQPRTRSPFPPPLFTKTTKAPITWSLPAPIITLQSKMSKSASAQKIACKSSVELPLATKSSQLAATLSPTKRRIKSKHKSLPKKKKHPRAHPTLGEARNGARCRSLRLPAIRILQAGPQPHRGFAALPAPFFS